MYARPTRPRRSPPQWPANSAAFFLPATLSSFWYICEKPSKMCGCGQRDTGPCQLAGSGFLNCARNRLAPSLRARSRGSWAAGATRTIDSWFRVTNLRMRSVLRRTKVMPPKAERKPRSFMKTCHSSGAAMRSAQRCRDAQRLAGARTRAGLQCSSGGRGCHTYYMYELLKSHGSPRRKQSIRFISSLNCSTMERRPPHALLLSALLRG